MSRSVPLTLSALPVVAGAMLLVVVAGAAAVRTGEAGPAPVCTHSFARWQGLAGHWEGTWTNHTFSSNGELTADVSINAGGC